MSLITTEDLDTARQALLETDEFESVEAHLASATIAFQEEEDSSYATMELEGTAVRLSDYALKQLASTLGVPTGYVLKCPGHLQAANLHYWQRQVSDRKTVRAVIGQSLVQAITSPNFLPLPNVPLFDALVEKVGRGNNDKVNLDLFQHSWLTTRMAMTHTDASHSIEGSRVRHVESDMEIDDIIRAGVNLMNSLVADHHTEIEQYAFRLICKNSMVTPVIGDDRERSIRYARGDDADPVAWLQEAVDDIGQRFEPMFQLLDAAAGRALEDPEAVIRDQLKHAPGPMREEVLAAYATEPNPTVWGVANAFTRATQDSSVVRPDHRVKMERYAGLYATDPSICTRCGLPAERHNH